MYKTYIIKDIASMDRWKLIDIIIVADPGRACLEYRKILNEQRLYQTTQIGDYNVI